MGSAIDGCLLAAASPDYRVGPRVPSPGVGSLWNVPFAGNVMEQDQVPEETKHGGGEGQIMDRYVLTAALGKRSANGRDILDLLSTK